MRKVNTLIFLIFSLVILSSCSIGRNGVEMLNDNEKESEIVGFDQILSYIEDKDSENMKGIFSQTVLDEIENIDNEIEYLFNIIQGEVCLYKDSGVGESETNEYGTKTKTVRSFYKVETDVDNYLVFLYQITLDTDKPDNVGVYSIRIIREEDRDTHFEPWQDMVIPGIYVPE